MPGLELLSPAVSFDVDMPRRTPTSAKKSPVQERLETWKAKSHSVTAVELLQQQEAATSRKHTSLFVKASTLAKRNDRARAVATRQKNAVFAALGEKTNTVAQKQAKAESKRAALIQDQVDKAALGNTKAREIANKMKEEREDQLMLQKQALEDNLRSASARKLAQVAATSEKAGTDYIKACQLYGLVAGAARRILCRCCCVCSYTHI
jgi:hypothetical protein